MCETLSIAAQKFPAENFFGNSDWSNIKDGSFTPPPSQPPHRGDQLLTPRVSRWECRTSAGIQNHSCAGVTHRQKYPAAPPLLKNRWYELFFLKSGKTSLVSRAMFLRSCWINTCFFCLFYLLPPSHVCNMCFDCCGKFKSYINILTLSSTKH